MRTTEMGAGLGWRAVADDAVQGRAQPALARCLRQYPGADLPRRIMARVLPMAAFQVCDPVPFLVQMKTDNAPVHVEREDLTVPP